MKNKQDKRSAGHYCKITPFRLVQDLISLFQLDTRYPLHINGLVCRINIIRSSSNPQLIPLNTACRVVTHTHTHTHTAELNNEVLCLRWLIRTSGDLWDEPATLVPEPDNSAALLKPVSVNADSSRFCTEWGSNKRQLGKQMFCKTVYCSVTELAEEHRFFYNFKGDVCNCFEYTVWIDASLLVSSSTNRPYAIHMGDLQYL